MLYSINLYFLEKYMLYYGFSKNDEQCIEILILSFVPFCHFFLSIKYNVFRSKT
jgi:hypothetical protein